MTHLLQLTINVPKSHRQPQCTLQLVCEDRVLLVTVDLRVPLLRPQHPKYQPAIPLVYPHFFCEIRYSVPQTKVSGS